MGGGGGVGGGGEAELLPGVAGKREKARETPSRSGREERERERERNLLVDLHALCSCPPKLSLSDTGELTS